MRGGRRQSLLLLGALVLLVAPVLGALVIWAIWQETEVLAPSTTTVIVEAPRPTATPPPTAPPPFLTPPTLTAAPLPAATAGATATTSPPGPASTSGPAPIASSAAATSPPPAASPAPVAGSAPASGVAPAPGQAGAAIDVIHVVEAGDTIVRIAQRYGVSPEAIQRANSITDRTRTLRIGERLIVPGVTATPAAIPRAPAVRSAPLPPTSTVAPTATANAEQVYEAEEGDTLSGIAERYGVTIEALLQANGFDDPDRSLQVGERIIIPEPDTP